MEFNFSMYLYFFTLCFSGKPIPEDMPKSIPWVPDEKRITETPFQLMPWVKNHQDQIKNQGSVPLFKPEKYQSDVYVHGFGDQGKAFKARSSKSETIFWLLQGEATLKVNGDLQKLQFDDIFLVPKGSWVEFQNMSEDSAVLSTTMDPDNKARIVM